jgi:glycosyltransferase involved in cell wall biosynthesis
MRVGMVAYAYYEGNRRIEQYANALVQRGDVVEIIGLNHGGLPAFETVDGARIYRVQERRRRQENFLTYLFQVATFMIRSFFFLAKRHFKEPYDVIHVHSVPDFLVFCALVPKIGGVPIILDIHDILPEFYLTKFRSDRSSLAFKLMLLIERVSIAFSDHVIIANPIWHERLLQRSATPGKVTTIWNYPDSKIFFPRAKKRSDEKFVLIYPGTLNWHQGLDIAIQAFAKVVGEVQNAEFWIYGEGPERENLIQLARQLRLDGKVRFGDFLPVKEVAELMADADLAIVPKRANSVFGTEAASTKIMEFMGVGVPVVVSRTKIDSLYHSDSTVRFFDSDDADNLAQAILSLYRSPALRKELASNALAYFAENRWDTKKAVYLAIVDRLAEQSRRSRRQDHTRTN